MTFKGENENEGQFIGIYSNHDAVDATAPRFGYDTATTDKEGVLCMWHSNRTEMGIHIVFAGSALRKIYEKSGCHAHEILKKAYNAGAVFTRLDLARDAQNENVSIGTIKARFENGENKGTARTWTELTSQSKGHTLYIGSRQSDKFIRIYNKAAEQMIDGGDWIRMEIETKGMIARAIANALATRATLNEAFDAAVKASLDLTGLKDYDAFFPSTEPAIGLPKIEKQSDTEKWIDTQVVPAVLRHLLENPDSKAVRRLKEALDFLDVVSSG